MRDEPDTVGAMHDQAGEGHHHGPPSEPARREATTAPQEGADWRAVVAVRAAAVRRNIAAMPPTRPLPPR